MTDTNPETKNPESPEATSAKASLVDALFDMGLEWASFGLDAGKRALETGAHQLEVAAKALTALGGQLGKRSDALRPADRAA